MIVDITNDILTQIKLGISEATVLSAYPSTSPVFPCIIVEELSNNSVPTTIDSGGEHYCDVSIEINIFTDNPQTKMSDAKALRNKVDAIVSQYKLNRDFSSTTPNYADGNIYRYTMRYSAIVDSNKVIYRR